MPRHTAQQGFPAIYTSHAVYATSLSEQIKEGLWAVGVERVNSPDLVEMGKSAGERFDADTTGATTDADTSVATVLWQNGLLGFVHDQRSHFYSVSDMNQLDIARDATEYVLHPCLLDSVRGIRSTGHQIVYPYYRD